MQKKVETAKKSLSQARIADDSHKKDISDLEEQLSSVEKTKAAYEQSIAGQSQSQGRDVQLEDNQVCVWPLEAYAHFSPFVSLGFFHNLQTFVVVVFRSMNTTV